MTTLKQRLAAAAVVTGLAGAVQANDEPIIESQSIPDVIADVENAISNSTNPIDLNQAERELLKLRNAVEDRATNLSILRILPRVNDEVEDWLNNHPDDRPSAPDGTAINQLQRLLGMSAEDQKGGFGELTSRALITHALKPYQKNTYGVTKTIPSLIPRIKLSDYLQIELLVKRKLDAPILSRDMLFATGNYGLYNEARLSDTVSQNSVLTGANETLTSENEGLQKQVQALKDAAIKACAVNGVLIDDSNGTFGRALVESITNNDSDMSGAIIGHCANIEDYPDGIPEEVQKAIIEDENVWNHIENVAKTIAAEERQASIRDLLFNHPEEIAEAIEGFDAFNRNRIQNAIEAGLQEVPAPASTTGPQTNKP